MGKKILKFLKNPWTIKIAIILLIIIVPCHAMPKWHSGSRTLKTDGTKAIKALLLSQDFESLNDIVAAGGSYSGVSLLPGKSGNAVKLDSPSSACVTYPTAGHFNIQKGTIEFWMAPLWDTFVSPVDFTGQTILQFQWGTDQSLEIDIAKVPSSPKAKGLWALFTAFNYGKRDDRRLMSWEPHQLMSFRPNKFNRIKLFWDFSLPNTDGFSLYYNGPGKATCSVTKNDGVRIVAPGINKVFSYGSGYYNLGQIVKGINAMPGFHATLIGDPAAQGFMVNIAAGVNDINVPAPGPVFQQYNSYLLLETNDFYAPIVWCAPIVPQALMKGATIYLGNRWAKDRPAHAIFDSLRVWDTPLLPVSPFPQHFFNPADPASIATFDALYANDGFCSAHETHATQPADCPILSTDIAPGEDVIFFERPQFEWVLPNYVPKKPEIKTTFKYRVPLGEYETVFFNIYSRIDLNNMVINNTKLIGPDIIAKKHLDLRVVYNWWQNSLDGTAATALPFYAPELMLHKDTIPNPQFDKTIGQFKIPTLVSQDHVDTAMQAYTAKQFSLTIYVPPGTPPGDYTGIASITADELKTPLFINLHFSVLPFTLRDSRSIAMPWLSLDDIWYYSRPSAMNLNYWLIYQKIMEEMTKYGIYGVQHCCVNDYDAGHKGNTLHGQAFVIAKMAYSDFIKKKVQLSQKAGMKMVCIYAGFRPATRNLEYTPELVALMQSYGFDPWLMGQDEFGVPGNVDNQVGISARVKSIGGLILTNTVYKNAVLLDGGYTTTTLTPNIAYTPAQTTLDGVSYIIGDGHLSDMMSGRMPKTAGRYETYYFQTRTLYPNYERYWCGYFRYLTGCNGPQPTWFVANADNWTDFIRRNLSAYGVVYPALDQNHNFQLIPTLHGCAMREGFKDDKYLATWKYYRDRAAKTHPREVSDSQAVVDGILARYCDKFPYTANAGFRNSMAQFAADRDAIINEILALIKLQSDPGLVSGTISGK